MVGVTTRAGRPTWLMARMARKVLPVPVGNTTTPRPPVFHQVCSASVWCGKGSRLVRSGHGGRLIGAGFVLVGNLFAPQVFDEGAKVDGFGAVDVSASVETAIRQRGQLLRVRPGNDQGAAVEGEVYGKMVHPVILRRLR